ncbi:ribbon-helix-helix domain-containing protein [Sulfurisphaera ohwakuensis]|uniref:ribbon-helix-helix domain-containing protein n=1 Tax=Sulfurisphaera ohwakuensis TaxID=69656 RepID=UPI0036F2FF2A
MSKVKNLKKVTLTVYIDKEDAETIDKLTKMEGTSRSAIIRKLVRAYARRHLKESS